MNYTFVLLAFALTVGFSNCSSDQNNKESKDKISNNEPADDKGNLDDKEVISLENDHTADSENTNADPISQESKANNSSAADIEADKPKKKNNFSNATSIVYRFRDSSVPPQYHRSLTYTATPTELTFVVDSYGDIIKKETVALTPEHWKKIVDAANNAGLNNKETKKEPGCTGGTGRSLTITKDAEVLYDGSAYFCGGSVSGNLNGDYESIAKAMKQGIDPNVFFHN
jgi:hypothetical protein